MAAKHYDYLVIGSGAATAALSMAHSHGLKVALVDQGPAGGTCLNVGCIPSKLLIFPADRVAEIEEAAALGIYSEIMRVDFPAIMKRMRSIVRPSSEQIRRGLRSMLGDDYYEGAGRFVGERLLEVNGQQVTADRVVIGAGARPLIPPIADLDEVPYLTNETLLDLEERPESLAIVGGGYIAAEYGHFFSAMGTKVTIIEMADRLVTDEEPLISDLLKRKLSERMTVMTGAKVVGVRRARWGVELEIAEVEGGRRHRVEAEALLLAAGRIPNSDLLQVEQTGVEVNAKGFVVANDRMETSAANIWALGDIVGEAMFRHAANEEAYVAAHNSLHDQKVQMEYHAIPRAVFSYPQIAAVGLTEAQAAKQHRLLIGYAHYSDVAKGEAMMEFDGFAKAVVDADDRRILGFHLIGPHAPILIQEVINVVAGKGTVSQVFLGIHIHPALPELVVRTLANLRPPHEWPHAPFAEHVHLHDHDHDHDDD